MLTSSAQALEFTLADPRLQQCIADLARRNQWSQAEQVTDIQCHNMGIRSLEGVDQFTQLQRLSLFRNRIASAQLSGLPQLEHLNLARNGLTQLTLSDLPKLTELMLFRNELVQLDLKHLPALTLVRINSNRLERFHYEKLPALTHIYLFDNQLEHVDIHNLPALEYMDARQNPMPDELYDDMDRQQGVTILHDGMDDDW